MAAMMPRPAHDRAPPRRSPIDGTHAGPHLRSLTHPDVPEVRAALGLGFDRPPIEP